MTNPPSLRLVGKVSQAKHDTEALTRATDAVRAVIEQGGIFWLATATEASLGVVCSDPQLEAAAFAEEIARGHKRSALGLE